MRRLCENAGVQLSVMVEGDDDAKVTIRIDNQDPSEVEHPMVEDVPNGGALNGWVHPHPMYPIISLHVTILAGG
eukprot:7491718-Pyramimonas_sp.AAC.1